MESNHPNPKVVDLQSTPLPLTVYLPIYFFVFYYKNKSINILSNK